MFSGNLLPVPLGRMTRIFTSYCSNGGGGGGGGGGVWGRGVGYRNNVDSY